MRPPRAARRIFRGGGACEVYTRWGIGIIRLGAAIRTKKVRADYRKAGWAVAKKHGAGHGQGCGDRLLAGSPGSVVARRPIPDAPETGANARLPPVPVGQAGRGNPSPRSRAQGGVSCAGFRGLAHRDAWGEVPAGCPDSSGGMAVAPLPVAGLADTPVVLVDCPGLAELAPHHRARTEGRTPNRGFGHGPAGCYHPSPLVTLPRGAGATRERGRGVRAAGARTPLSSCAILHPPWA